MVKIVEGSTCIAGGGGVDNMYFDTVEAVDGTDGYSNVWKLGLSESNAKRQEARYATVNIAAEDMDGHRVKGNSGDRATTITQQELFLAYNSVDITVSPESESSVTSLSYFDVTAPNTIAMGALATSEAYVLNRDTRTRVVVDSTALVYSESVQQIIDDSETLSEEEMRGEVRHVLVRHDQVQHHAYLPQGGNHRTGRLHPQHPRRLLHFGRTVRL